MRTRGSQGRIRVSWRVWAKRHDDGRPLRREKVTLAHVGPLRRGNVRGLLDDVGAQRVRRGNRDLELVPVTLTPLMDSLPPDGVESVFKILTEPLCGGIYRADDRGAAWTRAMGAEIDVRMERRCSQALRTMCRL